MKKLLMFIMMLLFITSLMSYSQDTIKFSYDAAGNRIQRMIVLGGNKGTEQREETRKETEDVFKDETFQPQTLKIYPNPTKGVVEIEIEVDSQDLSGKILITVLDINGRKIVEKRLDSYKTIVDISDQPNGLYILYLKKKNVVSQWKIIKQ